MKSIASFCAYAAFTAGLAGFSPSAALAAQGQDFPGTTCTCQKCAPGGGDLTGDCASVCKDKTVFSKGSEPHDYCKKAKTVTPNSSWLRALMIIAHLDARTLAEASGVPQPDIVNIMEGKKLEVDPKTEDKLIHALEVRGGVEITEDGVRLMQKPLKKY